MVGGEDVSCVFAMSTTVSGDAQKKSGELTQPIGRTRSMQRRNDVSDGKGGQRKQMRLRQTA